MRKRMDRIRAGAVLAILVLGRSSDPCARNGAGVAGGHAVLPGRVSIGFQYWFWRIFGATGRGLILHIGTHFRRLPMRSVERRGILPKGLKTVRVELAGNRVLVHACARSAAAACPRCG